MATPASVLSKISGWLNFGVALEDTILQKIPLANISNKTGNILSLVFVGTELAAQLTSELAAAQAAQTTTPAPVTPAAPVVAPAVAK